MLRSASLAIVQRIQLFFTILNLFDSISPGIVLIDKLHNFEEGICVPDSVCHGKRKGNFSLIIATGAMNKKCFTKNLNLIDLRYR